MLSTIVTQNCLLRSDRRSQEKGHARLKATRIRRDLASTTNWLHAEPIDTDVVGTRMSIESSFPSAEAMEWILATGTDEGRTQAVGQIDAILADDAVARH
jgi:hypothetical protein